MRWALAIAMMLLATPAFAADDAHGNHGGIADLLWPALNLILLLAVLVYFARKPIASYFAQRRSGIEKDVNTATDELANAEATYSKWQRRLIDLEQELEEIRATSRQRAEAERERILEDARGSAERIRQNATAAIDQELRQAREQLREDATNLAIEIAGERLEREITDADRDRLIDEFIARVAGGEDVPPARSS